tara:strand:+ start:3001 stop:3339 length:339 start_codon:yes stop_codon:yes gene_type:complete
MTEQGLFMRFTMSIGWDVSYRGSHQRGVADQLIADTLTDLFGGFTMFEGVGGWRAPDERLFMEMMRQYQFTDTTKTQWTWPPELKELIEKVKELTGEEAIYLERQVVNVEII